MSREPAPAYHRGGCAGRRGGRRDPRLHRIPEHPIPSDRPASAAAARTRNPFLAPHQSGRGGSGRSGGAGGLRPSGGPGVPAPPRRSPGVLPVRLSEWQGGGGNGGRPELPVDAQVLQIAQRAGGSFFRSARVRGIHVEVLTVGDPYDHYAVEVALPLTSVDSVLHGLLLTYVLLIGGGVLLAGVLGALIARAALARSSASPSRPSRSPARWTGRDGCRRPAPASCAALRRASTRPWTRSSARSRRNVT